MLQPTDAHDTPLLTNRGGALSRNSSLLFREPQSNQTNAKTVDGSRSSTGASPQSTQVPFRSTQPCVMSLPLYVPALNAGLNRVTSPNILKVLSRPTVSPFALPTSRHLANRRAIWTFSVPPLGPLCCRRGPWWTQLGLLITASGPSMVSSKIVEGMGIRIGREDCGRGAVDVRSWTPVGSEVELFICKRIFPTSPGVPVEPDEH